MTRPFTRDDAKFFYDGHLQYGDDVYRLAAWALAESERADALAAELADARAELAEARAELAAERGEAEGALPGWRWVLTSWYFDTERPGGGRTFLAVRRVEPREALARTEAWVSTDDAWNDRRIDMSESLGLRAAMRSAEAEARRLGLLVDDGDAEVGP